MRCAKGDLEANLALHLEILAQAYRDGVDLVVFPEMSLSGSVDPVAHPERLVSIDDPAVAAVTAATWTTPVLVTFGLAERADDGPWITQVVAGQGRVLGIQRKRHLGEGEDGFAAASL